MFEEKDGARVSADEYIVKIETIANSAPIGKPYEIWCSVDHAPPGDACIRWQASDQHGNTLPDAVWKSTTTDIGAEFPNMARGIVTVPHIFSGEITVTASLITSHAALKQQPGTKRLRFFAWDGFDYAPPHTIGFAFDKEVAIPLHREGHEGLDDANTVELSIRVLTAWGAPIEGAEVQWLLSPEVPELLFVTSNSPFSLLNPNNGGWSATLTNSSGCASIRVTSTRTLAATATARVPGVDGGGDFGTVFFVSRADPSVKQLPGRPVTVPLGNDGLLRIGADENSIPLSMPRIDPQYFSEQYIAFLYFEGKDRHILDVWIDSIPSSYQLPTSALSFGADGVGHSCDTHPRNYPVLYIQQRPFRADTEIYSTQYAGFITLAGCKKYSSI